MTAHTLLAALIASGPAAPPPPAGSQAAAGDLVRAVFRVFDGTQEVTADTRITLRVSGSEQETAVLDGPALTATIAPGIYDAQAIHHRDGRVLSVRWAERLVMVKYPDEQTDHLQVINVKPGYGALQLVLPAEAKPDPGAVSVEVSGAPADGARVLTSRGYYLVVAPAGTYDIRLSRPDGDELVPAVEIPADRTRMRPVGGDSGR